MITLTTDFGTSDSYVAEMKGVILQLNPGVVIVDVSHHIEPQDVAQGAFVLGSVRHSFPKDTVHVAVVDPGVGTSRRAVLLVTPGALFLAPDNGLLTYALRDSQEYRAVARSATFLDLMDVPVPLDCLAYGLSNPDLWCDPISDTFHGRDIFASVAAHMSMGTVPEEVGEPLESLVCLCIPHMQRNGDTLMGHVVQIDGFGNLITTIEGNALSQNNVGVLIKGRSIQGVSRSYAESYGLLAIVGSHGNLEISVKDGSAAQELNAQMGNEVVVEFLSSA